MQYGDIIELGRHRLMYGDATNPEHVHALTGDREIDLVLTDPPYGINIVRSGGRFKHHRDRIGNMPGDDGVETARKNIALLRDFADSFIIWGGQFFSDFLPPSPAWIVWDKMRNNKFSMGSCELAWTNCGGKRNWFYQQFWNGAFGRKSPLNPVPHVHPTQKPVELHMNIINDFTPPGAVILDCFGGSGTTLIAAEMTGRTCLMMEISPQYIQTIIDRYNKLTEGMITYED